jgi:hypothetical protein
MQHLRLFRSVAGAVTCLGAVISALCPRKWRGRRKGLLTRFCGVLRFPALSRNASVYSCGGQKYTFASKTFSPAGVHTVLLSSGDEYLLLFAVAYTPVILAQSHTLAEYAGLCKRLVYGLVKLAT